jgi:hypothetical protein
MELQLITYRGRAVAACTPRRVFFSGDIEARDPEDPVKRFVREMCMYAGTRPERARSRSLQQRRRTRARPPRADAR